MSAPSRGAWNGSIRPIPPGSARPDAHRSRQGPCSTAAPDLPESSQGAPANTPACSVACFPCCSCP
jgi:hypothetical protein